MTGLNKIVAAIREDAQQEAGAILEQARAEAARLLSEQQSKSDELCKQIGATTAHKVEEIRRAGISAVELQRRRKLLETKQEILRQTMEQALEGLYALPEPAYFELLLKLAAAEAQTQSGELLLSERDYARRPQDFEKRLSLVLRTGAQLAVAATSRRIDGGFILKYGDIEQNCSFRAMFDARWDELTDKARDILFS